jgi:glycosyltransferase involved in cell wall biosynthesis
MKILLNGLQLSKRNTGVQYYTERLFEELAKINNPDLEFHLLRPNDQFFKSSGKIHGINVNGRLKRIFFEQFILPGYIGKHRYGLFHSTSYISPYFLNRSSVLTIHDLLVYDYPALCQSESVIYFKLFLGASIKKASHIIAVSQKVKDDIIRIFNVYPGKIDVIHLGINPIFKRIIDEDVLAQIRKKYEIPEKYILFVGNIEPKKNLERLILAYSQLKGKKGIKHKLVIVGKKGWKYEATLQLIDKLKISEEIILTGYVVEKDLPAIYSMADMFVFPSIYEGFGIPPLEAMACGTPVIVSNTGALPETTGGSCLQVNPFSVDEIAHGIQQLITDNSLRQRVIQQGYNWANSFSWEKTATKTIEVYLKCLKGKLLS